ncbi:MAG TPA: inositol monophosphatase family protein, partial [Solirubrobacterales bacterium]|nr:inositol monophosphatase family protein [Solirubrobacterales bacterium]
MGLSPHNPPLAQPGQRALELDWTAICEEIVGDMKVALDRYPTFSDRNVGIGEGAGGDNTLVIDEAAEDAVFAVLERVARETGAGFTAISEERGTVEFGDSDVHVIIDPIDGSLNAKRVAQSYSLSLAVAAGTTMADVVYGFVYDFGSGEQWVARLGEGATVNGRVLDPAEAGNDLEVVGLESTKPSFLTPQLLDAMHDKVQRIRSIGSIALTLCQVGAARFDGMLSLRPCRSVDAAAGQLIVREAGGHVIFGDPDDPL